MQKHITILLVDDDHEDQSIFKEAINQLEISAECVVAMDGNDAIEKLATDPEFLPEYIFMDLVMPKMDGKKCIREIRKIKNNKNTPIIIHSSVNLHNDAAELIKTGASYYFQKPGSVGELTKILKKVLSAHIPKN